MTVTVIKRSQSKPFALNQRGLLIHRVRDVSDVYYAGKVHHQAVHYWCGNQSCGPHDLLDVPPKNRLLCARCEGVAVAASQPKASKLAKRHVCVGKIRAVRLCCGGENN